MYKFFSLQLNFLLIVKNNINNTYILFLLRNLFFSTPTRNQIGVREYKHFKLQYIYIYIYNFYYSLVNIIEQGSNYLFIKG